MAWQQIPYTVPLLFASGVSFGLAVYVFARRDRGTSEHAIRPFVGVALAAGLWSFAYWMQLSLTVLEAKLFWGRFAWLAVAVMEVAWPLFVLGYTGRTRWFAPRYVAGLAVVPGVSALAFWTDRSRWLVNSTVDLHHGDIVTLSTEPGPLLLAFLVYAYALNLLLLGVLAHDALDSRGLRRNQLVVLLVAGAVPMASSWASLMEWTPTPHVDFTPISFAFTTVLLAAALFRYRLLELGPVAREQVIAEMPDGLVVLDGDRRVVEINDVAARLFEDREAVVGAPAADVFAEFPQVLECLDDECEIGSAPQITVERDGGPRMYAVSTSRITAGATERGSIVALRDVTGERTAERRFKALIEKSSNVIMVLDEAGRLQYASPSFEDVLGYDREGMVDTSMFELIHPDDHEHAHEKFREVVETGESRQVELRARTAADEWRRFEVVGEDLFDDPVIDGMVVSARDVTERRNYEQRLRVLNRILRHDMRNNLNVIMGYTDLLLESTADEARRDHLETIRRKTDGLLELSENARQIDFAFHRDQEPEALDLVPVVVDRLDAYRREYPEATFAVDLPAEAWVRADELVESAVDNVLENALEHNDRASPRIEVTLRPAGRSGYAELRVADDGPGIPEMNRRVLEAGMETQMEHVTGLGLWLVNWIVTSSNGEFLIEDNAPRGTVVTLRLPGATAGDDAREPAPEPDRQAPPDGPAPGPDT